MRKTAKYDLVAPCGDYCGGCGQYNGTIVTTAKQMRDLAGLYGFKFRSTGAFDFAQFMLGLKWFIAHAKCPGCRDGGGPAWCKAKNCCSEKRLRICFQCPDFPCSKVKEVADPDTMDRYKKFKEVGLDKWIKDQVQKAKRGYEIHLQRVLSLKP